MLINVLIFIFSLISYLQNIIIICFFHLIVIQMYKMNFYKFNFYKINTTENRNKKKKIN